MNHQNSVFFGKKVKHDSGLSKLLLIVFIAASFLAGVIIILVLLNAVAKNNTSVDTVEVQGLTPTKTQTAGDQKGPGVNFPSYSEFLMTNIAKFTGTGKQLVPNSTLETGYIKCIPSCFQSAKASSLKNGLSESDASTLAEKYCTLTCGCTTKLLGERMDTESYTNSILNAKSVTDASSKLISDAVGLCVQVIQKLGLEEVKTGASAGNAPAANQAAPAQQTTQARTALTNTANSGAAGLYHMYKNSRDYYLTLSPNGIAYEGLVYNYVDLSRNTPDINQDKLGTYTASGSSVTINFQTKTLNATLKADGSLNAPNMGYGKLKVPTYLTGTYSQTSGSSEANPMGGAPLVDIQRSYWTFNADGTYETSTYGSMSFLITNGDSNSAGFRAKGNSGKGTFSIQNGYLILNDTDGSTFRAKVYQLYGNNDYILIEGMGKYHM